MDYKGVSKLDKVNEFETAGAGLSKKSEDYVSRVLQRDEANEHYIFSSIEELVANPKELKAMIEHHIAYQVPRLDILNSYYLGKNSYIYGVKRRFDKEKSDHRISHNYARYISQFIQGYLVGDPIKFEHDDKKVAQEIEKINNLNSADRIHNDLVLDLSKFGRAYEIVMRNNDDQDRFYLSDVMETFVIYSDTVEREPIGAVRYVRRKDANSIEWIRPTLYGAEKNYEYESSAIDEIRLVIESEKDHTYGAVQIIEYQNNRFRQGDYENVISLIDAYDSAQSDTANYMTDLNDALLAIIGRVNMPENIARDLKEANAMLLEPAEDTAGKTGAVSVDYKYKKYDVAGTEAYKKRISEDIHKFSNTPNMNDENFASNVSGVAMKYKLFGLEQARANKENLFIEGLRKRYKLIATVKGSIYEFDKDLSMNDLRITFTPNFPEATETELKAFIEAGGEISQETLLGTLSFVDNVQNELERIAKEKAELNDFTDAERTEFDRIREELAQTVGTSGAGVATEAVALQDDDEIDE